MSNPSVYLAGPIAGLTIREARVWRTKAIAYLKTHNIRGIDPLSGAERLGEEEIQSKQAPELDPFTSAKGILCQDFYFCTTSDMVLINVLDATRVSIGSCIEAGWAYRRAPLVIVSNNDVHDHTLLRTMADYWVDNLNVALDIVVKVIGR